MLFETAPLPLLVIYTETGTVARANAAACSLLGETPSSIIGHKMESLVSVVNRARQQPGKESLRTKVCLPNSSGEERCLDVYAVTAEWRSRPAVQVFLVDTTVYRRYEQQLQYLESHDALTGAFNRSHFRKTVLELREDEEAHPIAVVSADITELERINQTLGQEVGDRVLQATAQVLQSCTRASDLICRTGDDNFCILMPNSDIRGGHRVCQCIREEARQSTILEGTGMAYSLALGTGVAEWRECSLEDALRAAERDLNIYKAGRGLGTAGKFVQSLLALLSERDFETERHTRRLRDLAVRLGRAAGLSHSELAHLATLALVHDVGKVGVPDQILLKPGPLTDEEWLVMRHHVEIGYRLAISMPELNPIAGYILHHHERWDGKGYLKGLKGEEIPLVCRVLAIVDAYDAMTNDRPYRKALPHTQAISELVNNSYSQFDGRLVDQFVEIVEHAS